ncbi:GntR family transcriptional regulator [Pseudomonas machongensis]
MNDIDPMQSPEDAQRVHSSPFDQPDYRLNRHSQQPMYNQLASRIKQAIRSGQLKPGECIGTEKELGAIFAVSRITVRQAVDTLVETGLLVRRHGKGTFVAYPRIRHNLNSLNRLVDAHRALGKAGTCILLGFGTRQAAEHIKSLFDAPPVNLTRLIVLETTPISVSTAWLLPAAEELSQEKAQEKSTARLLTEDLGLHIGKTEYALCLGYPDREVAQLLKVNEGTPVMCLTRRRYLNTGQLAEYLTATLLPDYYEFSFSSEDDFTGQALSRYFLH